MSDQELKEFIEALRRVDEDHDTPERARQLLVEEGVLTQDGQLAEPYR